MREWKVGPTRKDFTQIFKRNQLHYFSAREEMGLHAILLYRVLMAKDVSALNELPPLNRSWPSVSIQLTGV